MQLRHLRTFSACAATLNFTRAGEQIHLSQSSVTEQIQALEADLGVKLFIRGRGRLALTPAGEKLVPHAAELLKRADETRTAVAEASGTVAGPLVIGGLETLCAARLPGLVAEFLRRHPKVDVTVKVDDSAGVRSGIGSGELDVGFFFGEPQIAEDMQAEVIAEETVFVILPANHRLAGSSAIGPGDVDAEMFLVTPPGCVYRRMFDAAFAAGATGGPGIAGVFASIGSVIRLVETGLGCALVPGSAVADRPGNFIAVPWLGAGRTVPIAMAWRRRRRQTPALDSFLATARSVPRRSDQPLTAVDMDDRP